MQLDGLFWRSALPYTAGMDSSQLTAEQLGTLLHQITAQAKYLQSLAKRIDEQKFPTVDRLRLRTLFALDQVEALQKLLEQLAKERETRDIYMMGTGRGKMEREPKRQ